MQYFSSQKNVFLATNIPPKKPQQATNQLNKSKTTKILVQEKTNKTSTILWDIKEAIMLPKSPIRLLLQQFQAQV
jgi:hypothetical protein